MSNIWEVLVQTLTLSGVGLFILFMKYIFRDKLQPGWHLGVWIIFGITALLPAGIFGRYALINWPLLVNMLKVSFGDYETLSILAPVPLYENGCFSGAAGIFFAIYCLGIIIMAARYFYLYGKLRSILNKAVPAGEELQSLIRETAEKYGQKECSALKAEGISSAFLCGVFRPVLIIPSDEEADEKVILHELIHFSCHDTWKGIAIAAVRCIHWCNPFLWYCLNIIGNDVESRCDHKVLSLLEGEERRDYGRILLSMANDRYARMPGTSSMANGGKNIRRRIETIVWFKKYPDGMKLAAICIAIIMAVTSIGGFQASAEDKVPFLAEDSLARGITVDCTTMAGALDTYGKSLLTGNVSYRMMCASEEKRKELAEKGFSSIHHKYDNIDMTQPFTICNIVKNREGGYDAVIGFIQRIQDTDDECYGNYISQKITVSENHGKWIVEEQGGFRTNYGSVDMPEYGCKAMPYLSYSAEHEDYTVEVKLQQSYTTVEREYGYEEDFDYEEMFYDGEMAEGALDLTPYVNGKFLTRGDTVSYELIYHGEEKEKIRSAGVSTRPMENLKKRPAPEKIKESEDVGCSSSDGANYESRTIESMDDWKGNRLSLGGGGGSFSDSGTLSIQEQAAAYAADLYINGKRIAELVAEPDWEVDENE